MPPGRLKFNHAQGVLAKVIWVDTLGHPYTGLYKGNSECLIRMSEGNFNVPEMPGLTPTFGLKCPRTKIKSANLVANTSFEPNNAQKTPAGTSPFDFFARNFSASIPLFSDPLDQITVQRKFAEWKPEVGATGKAEFSKYTKDGVAVSAYKFPFNLSFRPPAAMKGLVVHTQANPWFTQMKSRAFPIGKVLFEVFAITEPQVTTIPNPFPNAKAVKIGEIRLNSAIITSSFGDKRLFFQHERMNLDWESEPAWKDYTALVDFDNEALKPWNGTPIPDFFPGNPVNQKAAVRGQLS